MNTSRPGIKISLAGVALLVLGLSFSNVLYAQGDGPRAYQLIPEGTQTVSQFLLAMRGNSSPSDGLVIEGADIDINMGITQYALAIDIGGKQAGLLAIVPYGNVAGSLSTQAGETRGSDSGLGDVILGAAFGIYGTPNLNMEEYTSFDPGFAMALLARSTLPTGSYSDTRNLNMGGNRWIFELGLPMMYYIGTSFLDASLTSFELQPKIAFFTENDDVPGSANRLQQDPLFTLEGHITRNFGRAFWASIDGLYEYGGETETDGINDANKQKSFSLGVTGALNMSAQAALKVSYAKTVSGNPAGSDGKMLRAQLIVLFF